MSGRRGESGSWARKSRGEGENENEIEDEVEGATLLQDCTSLQGCSQGPRTWKSNKRMTKVPTRYQMWLTRRDQQTSYFGQCEARGPSVLHSRQIRLAASRLVGVKVTGDGPRVSLKW